LFKNGLFTRTRKWIEMDIADRGNGRLAIRSHSVLPADNINQLPPAHAAEMALLRGLDAWRRGDIQAASENFWEARERQDSEGSPEFAMGSNYFEGQLSYFLALTVLREDRRSQAYAHLRGALEAHPNFPLALNQLARLSFEDNQLEDALRQWESSAALDPSQGEVTALVAHLRVAASAATPAIREAFLAAVDAPPSTLLTSLGPLLKKHRRNSDLVALAARTHLAMGDPAKALELLEQIRKARWTEEAHYLAGRANLLQGKPAVALAEFRRVWKMNPKYRDVLTWLVNIPAARNQLMEARAFAEEGLGIEDAPTAVLRARIGIFEYRQGHDYEASTHLQAGLEGGLPARLRAPVASALHQLGSDRR
jgi:tetratricopeptide (TPR) repeat protein